MASKDGAVSFDFERAYVNIKKHSVIEYQIIDGRKVIINFEETKDGVAITESFEPEAVNSEELQRTGWQNTIDNFKKYTEQ